MPKLNPKPKPKDANRLLVERALPRDGEERDCPTPTQRRVNDAPHRSGHAGGMADPELLKGRGFSGPATRPSPPRPRSVTVNLAESPLGWLKARGHLSQRQFDAGERLRGDWTIAGLAPSVTMRWDAAPQSRTARGPAAAIDPTLAQIAAKRRTEAALDAAGAGLRDVLWRIVCAGEGMESAERALGWPARAGRVVLTLALDRLADYYRIA